MIKIHLNWLILLLIATCAVINVSSVAEFCVQCSSKTDPLCATEPSKYFAKQCTNATGCYTRVLNGTTIRGCVSELDDATVKSCNNPLECLICSTASGCNREFFPTGRAACLQCEGNDTSVCASDVYLRPTICPIYKLGDKCFIRRKDTNGTTSFMRGCLSYAKTQMFCVNESNCFTCEGSGCNNLRANSTDIPMAKDSASELMNYSGLILLLPAAVYLHEVILKF